jgi:hypothetical protein
MLERLLWKFERVLTRGGAARDGVVAAAAAVGVRPGVVPVVLRLFRRGIATGA